MINDVHTTSGKTLADVLRDFKIETVTFVATRAQLLQEELRQKVADWKASIPAIVIGSVLLLTAWFLATAAIVVALAAAFPGNPWAYVISFAIVASLYGIIGGIVTSRGAKALSKRNLMPEKTIRVLQEDKVWLESQTTRLSA